MSSTLSLQVSFLVCGYPITSILSYLHCCLSPCWVSLALASFHSLQLGLDTQSVTICQGGGINNSWEYGFGGKAALLEIVSHSFWVDYPFLDKACNLSISVSCFIRCVE